MSRKLYLSAPLPFVGQKRMFARQYIQVLRDYPDNAVYVDQFGGSGLLSHITKRVKPQATVVYNDFDNYRQRLANIPRTNLLLADLRRLVSKTPRHNPVPRAVRENIFQRLGKEEKEWGYVDYITLSSSLMFSMKYKTSLEGMQRETIYNNIRKADYQLCPDYLDGITITHQDYREVFKQYKCMPNVIFLVDPPYLSTDVTTYNMSWGLSDYLDVLTVLQGHPFVYFTSNKSSILELCEWMGKNRTLGNPFEHCHKLEFNAHMNYNSSYTDMMLYTSKAP